MNTLILATIIRILIPLCTVLSLYLLIRGHNLPGGGFIGALVLAIALLFYAMIFGVDKTKQMFSINPMKLIGLGLLLALLSALPALLVGEPLFTAQWLQSDIVLITKIGTPLVFDIGVYLLVIGAVLKITFIMSEQ